MKKVILIATVLLGFTAATMAQVFNTGLTIAQGDFSVGINPVYEDIGDGRTTFFFYGGYGVASNVDLAFHYDYRDGEKNDYIGADVEINLFRDKFSASVAAGGHLKGDNLGFDGILTLSLPIVNGVEPFTGLDSDWDLVDVIENGEEKTEIRGRLWIPLGVDITIHKDFALIIEADIKASELAYNIFGGGLVFYIR